MAKKNKGTTRSKRHNDNIAAAAKAEVLADTEERLTKIYQILVGLPYDQAIGIMIRGTIGLEKTAEELGAEFEPWSPHFSGKDFTLCRRCEFNGRFSEDETGVIGSCSNPMFGGSKVLTCRTDGCTFGIEKVR